MFSVPVVLKTTREILLLPSQEEVLRILDDQKDVKDKLIYGWPILNIVWERGNARINYISVGEKNGKE